MNICEVPIHDAELIAIELSENSGVNVRFKTDDVICILHFHNVVVFEAGDFQTKNIAYDLSVGNRVAFPDDKVSQLLREQGIPLENEYAKSIINKLHNGDLSYYELTPTLGCWFYCVCENFSWE